MEAGRTQPTTRATWGTRGQREAEGPVDDAEGSSASANARTVTISAAGQW